eukprot:jgi/Chrzof1/10136/Cz04g30080.t1
MLRTRSCTILLHRLLQNSRPCAIAHGGLQCCSSRQLTCAAAALLSLDRQPPNSFSPLLPAQWGVAGRFLSTQQPKQEGDRQDKQQDTQRAQEFDSLELTDERARAITDKIPQKPMTIVEGTSYTIVILFAFAVLGFFVYNFLAYFIFEPVALTCFNHTLELLKKDPRITVRLGNNITAYGQESYSRVARQQIPHTVYKDANGLEHVVIQFHLRGPGGRAVVDADMYKDSNGNWQYSYLIVDIQSGNSPVQRLNIISQ